MAPLTLLAVLSPAFALTKTDPPPAAWSWPKDTEVFYHVETSILSPRGRTFLGEANVDAKGREVDIAGDLSCTAKPEGKGSFVSCHFGWVKVTGTAWNPAEQAGFDHIMGEWATAIGKARFEFLSTKDGGLRDFDLLGLEGKDSRTASIIQAQRSVMQRVFCAFDFPLPAKTDDWIRGWKSRDDNSVLQFPLTSGTIGASEIHNKHVGEKWGFVAVDSEGKATLTPGAAVDQGSTQLVDVAVVGEALFEPATGLLVYRDFTMDGRLSASSIDTGPDAYYYQVLGLQRIEHLGTVGEAPLSFAAQKAPKVAEIAPPPPEGTALVPFAELGMQPFYSTDLPDAAKDLGLPTSTVNARVLVSAGGSVTSVFVTGGYAVLKEPTENALMGAKFPARAAPYAVDVTLEWRVTGG